MQATFPLLFVLLWSTGFIGAKYGMPHAEPLTFLLLRYAAVIVLMGAAALIWRAPWPRDRRQWAHIGVSGVLVHGTYLGGVFVAISRGLPAGVTSLVVGLQPILTAACAGWLFSEQVVWRQRIGLLLGLAGCALVVSGRFGHGGGLDGLPAAVLALFGITAGTLYQKRFCPSFDFRSGAVLQFVPAAAVTLVAASLMEHFRVDFVPDFLFALGWLVLVLSLGAVTLLNYLIRSGTAVNTASLFYLSPPATALVAWLLFDERLSLIAGAGMAVAVLGVYLARKPAVQG